jgi:hypothetical protein
MQARPLIVSCRRQSAVVNLNCVTNRAAQWPRYKLSYDAKAIQQHTHFSQDPILATPAPNRATCLLKQRVSAKYLATLGLSASRRQQTASLRKSRSPELPIESLTERAPEMRNVERRTQSVEPTMSDHKGRGSQTE